MNLKRLNSLVLTAAAILTAAAGSLGESCFNSAWKFALTDDNAATATFNDSQWRILDLPHDWAIEGDFSKDNPSGTGGGALPGGTGWYRKHFSLTDLQPGEKVFIDFDGAYMNASVYINGHLLGTRPYGYASFSYDITPWLNKKEENIIAVKVDNSEQPNSRWYSGCGIYRNVRLRRKSPVHVSRYGHYARPHDVSGNSAGLTVTTTLDNTSEKPFKGTLTTYITYNGNKAAEQTRDIRIGSGKTTDATQEFKLDGIKLWSCQSPALYTVTTILRKDGTTIDSTSTVTGFKTCRFDPEKGFFLNGKPMKINGVCLHHDAGALGAVVNRRAIQRQLQIMKDMGVNAVRCSHNPPAPELLELCDTMGLLVMDETFDMWHKKKTEHDYARYFDDWHETDLTEQVLRDRNHPSIFMWSIGNEVLEQWSDAKADTLSLEQANLILNFGHSADMLAAADGELTVNSLLTIKLADMVRALDPDRPVTAGCNEPDPGNHLFRSGALDIIGYNYHDDYFHKVPGWFLGKPFLITESVSALMTRGHYVMPSDSVIIAPDRWDIPYYDPSFACSAYDNCHVPWGNSHEGTMRHVRDNDFIMGQFIWTGFDYIGEPTPYGWPARSSYFGIVDLAGFPKDIYYMYQSQWRPDMNVLHLFPHWNWEEGQTVDLWAYYNNADEIELFINGVSQGIRTPNDSTFHSSWRVKFVPGTVTAISRRNGKEIARNSISTAGQPAQIRLTPDRRIIDADGYDLSYVTVEILDKDGNICPTADNLIHFNVAGAGCNAGVDNGSPTSLERFKADNRQAFNGKALIIIRSTGIPGEITLTAESQGLQSSTEIITAK